ncbi:hypothetical protein BJ322DRAFT_1190856 [Thelephora terrestris]|uniref:Uncharacterized protein n=1 Tax=Thelephora terrestris TaxID=56493 RepID=A0A9P6L7N8_9AGAM|nr:hypothetical protein BJ322DRAFT_1190853 [Thelephora terrestris]KAF9786234.1 hypothetical protein BJ322DRAFT_1190856 [Thelephora terrestris]
MPRLQRKPKGPATPGVVGGFVFGSVYARPRRVSFTSVVPQGEGFDNPQYIKVEEKFSKKVRQSRIHDCIVFAGRDIFLVSTYWEGEGALNRAVEAACPGLEWRGEIAVVQAGRFVTFYKRFQNSSAVSKVVSKFISEYKYCVTVGDPLPTNIVASV